MPDLRRLEPASEFNKETTPWRIRPIPTRSSLTLDAGEGKGGRNVVIKLRPDLAPETCRADQVELVSDGLL